MGRDRTRTAEVQRTENVKYTQGIALAVNIMTVEADADGDAALNFNNRLVL